LSRYHSYINSADHILSVYNGDEPLSSFLKKYFSLNKKYGSKDRKQISHLCYCFFRLGKEIMNVSIEEKLLIALFLCSGTSSEILKELKPGWNNKNELPLNEKLLLINYSLLIQNVFPWKAALTEGIDHEKFCESFFIQPDLFLRLRPGKEKIVVQKLQQAGIKFKMISETCLALPNASKIDEIVELDKEAVVQDYSSQRTGEFVKPEILNLKSEISVWDCCAGSGGKSIMAYDINPMIELTVSDTRESILSNLKKRFKNAEIKKYKSFVADPTSQSPIPNSKFQAMICDAPCTGSGTWSRTPEQLYFFDENLPAGQAGKIEEYSTLQKKIVSNAIPHLKPEGTFIYITCSVFKKENEEVAMYIKENFHLELKQMEVLKGYDKKADSMFIAIFEKPL
jgi:16S rRNA (cytosine967-C5)-methyltransferase